MIFDEAVVAHHSFHWLSRVNQHTMSRKLDWAWGTKCLNTLLYYISGIQWDNKYNLKKYECSTEINSNPT